MPNIIKDAAIINDNYQVIAKDADITSVSQLPTGDIILPLDLYLNLKDELGERLVGVWLDSDQAPQPLAESLNSLALVAINFPAFADGRGYSYAYILRMQLAFKGEIRAIGDVLQDQMHYLNRSGFNSFAMREDQNLEQAIVRLKDFSKSYQAAVLQQSPLFASR
ncbi:MAG: DUF934 domain-containing protein [Sinobacterium sp.]|nr:DUF934 domain-containing protein [Sinobacterium sp.]